MTVFDKYNFQNNWGWLEEIKDNKKLTVKLGDIEILSIDKLVKKMMKDSFIVLIGIPYFLSHH